MKRFNKYSVILLVLLTFTAFAEAKKSDQDNAAYVLIKGRIVDSASGSALVFGGIAIQGTNLSTVSNSEGRFSIKVPQDKLNNKLEFTFLGYETQLVPVSSLKADKNNTIRMKAHVVHLSEFDVFPNDPLIIINNVLDNLAQNYPTENQLMTAFYRETIKKRRNYAALAEAVVEINKPSTIISRSEQIRMLKGRKGVDISKMDTVLFKLQGGAHSMMAMDIAKYPYAIIDPEVQDDYHYYFDNLTRINDELHLVISFKQRQHITLPMFYGKLYIHAETMAISSATFNLNTTNKSLAGSLFIRKKPMGCQVYPEYASYQINYRRQGDKWYYNYARGDVKFNINWEKRLFNTSYTTSSELAVTDRQELKVKSFKGNERIKKSAVMNEEVEGFYDQDFWGEYNVIEPEKSINTAIKKIAKNIEKLN